MMRDIPCRRAPTASKCCRAAASGSAGWLRCTIRDITPWNTDDGTGSWGGDHTPAIGAAADKDRVYLLWGIRRDQPHVDRLSPGWPEDLGQQRYGLPGVGVLRCGRRRQVRLRADRRVSLRSVRKEGRSALLLPQPAPVGGRPPADPSISHSASGNSRWASGPTVSLLPGFVYKDAAMINIDSGANRIEDSRFKRTWEKLATNDFGPQELARNALGLAVHGDIAYVAKYLEEQGRGVRHDDRQKRPHLGRGASRSGWRPQPTAQSTRSVGRAW